MHKLILLAAGIAMASPVTAQIPAQDPSSTLAAALPPDIAQQVLARIAEARGRQLPAAALENRALELMAKGVAPADVLRAVAAQEEAMAAGKQALASAGRADPADDEIEAAGLALAKGVDGESVSALAKSAPSGRSLAVPLAVMASLIDRGLPADAAIRRVQDRLAARATDQELGALPSQADQGLAHKPPTTGTDLAATRRPGHAGPPASVPTSAGTSLRPSTPPAPPMPPAGGRP